MKSMLFCILLVLSTITTLPSALADEVIVRLIIEHTALFPDCDDFLGGSQVYFKGAIGDRPFNSRDNPLIQTWQGCVTTEPNQYCGWGGSGDIIEEFANEHVLTLFNTIKTHIRQWLPVGFHPAATPFTPAGLPRVRTIPAVQCAPFQCGAVVPPRNQEPARRF